MARDVDQLLRGHKVACTGRFASMTRPQIADVIARFGGQFCPTVTEQTTDLVIGQEGWPLLRDGRVAHKLTRAQRLAANGQPIAILSEEAFLSKLGVTQTEEVRRRYSLPELCALLKVSRNQVRGWVNAGLIRPAETVHGVWFFDFTQVSAIKMLTTLLRRGVSTDRLRKSLVQLRLWLDDSEPLTRLLEQDGQLLVRLAEDRLADAAGQLHFDFAETELKPSIPVCASGKERELSAEEWNDIGFEHEQAGRFEEAIAAYRQALLTSGPDQDFVFNLAHALFAAGHKEQAVERYWQAVELAPSDCEAWCNLGVALAEIERTDEAIRAFEESIRLNPNHGDAHFNLADTLDAAGRRTDARPHWQAYLRHESKGPWADYARARLFAS